MNDEHASGAYTPLSKTLQDSTTTAVAHEADMRNRDSPLAGQHSTKHSNPAHAASSFEHGTTPARAAQSTSQVGDCGSSSISISMGSKNKVVGSADSAGINDDSEDWDELDKLELDSQTMRQLIETEEFYMTQAMMTADISLSQELVEPPIAAKAPMNARSASAGGVQEPHSARTVPSPVARSVPVTPTAAHPVYVSDSDSVQSNRGGAASGSFVPQHRYPQGRSSTGRFSAAQGPESAARKTNLFSRLAPHIPPRPPAPPSSRQRPQASAPEIHFDLGTSLLISPSAARETPTRPAGQSSLAQASASPRHFESMAEEIQRLKEENAQVRAEFEALQAQLYTKDGEVKMVRDNLASTEIENTRLQERLSNQISTATATQEQSEAALKTEIERLKTELLFQKHEASTAAIVQTPTRTATAAGTPRSGGVRRTDGTRSLSSGPNAYPDFDEFMSTPHQMPTPKRMLTRATLSSPTAASVPKQQAPQKRDRGVSTSSLQAPEAAGPLLDILAGISKLSGTNFGGLVLLAVQLSKTARNVGSIQDFHELSCTTVHRISGVGSYEQLEAVLQLLLQTIDRLPEIRDAWLVDRAISANERDGAGARGSAGQRRLGQLSAVICETLQADIKAAAQMRRGSRESAMCGRAIAAHVRLLVRLIGLQPAAALDIEAWTAFDPCSLGAYLTPGMHLHGLAGILDLLFVLIQTSAHIWRRLRDAPVQLEGLLLSAIKRLRLAFATNEPRMLDSHCKLLRVVAAAVFKHEEHSKALINAMRRLSRALVQWFLDERSALTSGQGAPAGERRVAVMCEHMKCLNLMLLEVADVVALLDGDDSPLFFAFVAATTRVMFGEAPFNDSSDICELAGNLLAFAVTEDEGMSIRNLADYP
ncbi:hypothetical protein GGF43_002457 [Coemansia sp. RSA 2618]|nr:hypothetical protein GGF43_002457 [Coemansia sp. RSA 2618]